MIPRTFVQRAKPVHIQEQDEWVAVRGASTSGGVLDASLLSLGAAAVERSGWRFLRSEEAPDFPGAEKAKVFARNGRLLLAPGSIVAKFRADLSRQEIEGMLAPTLLRIAAPLAFAQNLYELKPLGTELHDAIELAEGLIQSGKCEFAEPLFLEFVGHREVAA